MIMALRLESPSRFAGKEIFNIKPIVLGGAPNDPANKTVLNRAEHIKAVRYWNEVIANLREDKLL
jgi:hypothetical protein